MRPRRDHGHVFYEVYLLLAVLGIVTAVCLPHWTRVRQEVSAHECALALDTGKTSCPLTGEAYQTGDNGLPCCPNAYRHGLETLCAATKGGPSTASLHPPPSRGRRILWTAAGVTTGGLAALVFGGVLLLQVISFVRNPKEWWQSLNRPHF